VNLDGSATEAEAVSFPQRSYIIKSTVSIYENFESAPKQVFYENKPVTLYSGLTINVLKDAHGIHHNQTIEDPSPPRLQTLRVTAGSIVKFSWAGLATTIKLEVRQAHRPHTIIFFDPSGNTIETKQLPYRSSGDLIPLDFEYKAPAGRYISHFQINAAQDPGTGHLRWFYLDDLTIN
ncbi:hypothetical protein, partial [Pseudomonas sp. GW456-12-1-14-TSB6]